MELIDKIKQELKESLSEKRYIHSLGTMERAEELAKIYGVDVEKARLAGLTHDIAKEMTKEESLQYIKEHNIEIDEIEEINVKLLHGKIGANMLKEKYGLCQEIQDAILYHTTTDKNMDMLAKIIYVADKTENNRKSKEFDIEYERELANKDIDAAIIYILDGNIEEIIKKGKLVHPKAIETRNSLLIRRGEIGMKNKGEKGVTLVALVITIVLLLILAGISIKFTLGDEGIIKRAQNTANDYKDQTEGIASHINNVDDWIDENVDKVKNEVNKKADDNGTIDGKKAGTNNPIIPKGYTPIDAGDAKWGNGSSAPAQNSVDHGLVIKDDAGNEWVWVPVEASVLSSMYVTSNGGIALSGNVGVTTKMYTNSTTIGKTGDTVTLSRSTPNTTDYREPDIAPDYDKDEAYYKTILGYDSPKAMAESFTADYANMISSIKKYGGFYIGRYELSNEGVQKGKATLTGTNWYNLYKKCTTLNASDKVESKMIWGIQWDLACDFISKKGEQKSITNSTAWGNYSNSSGNAAVMDGETKKYGSKQVTGFSEYWKANNIYDLAGNCNEWTQEAGSTNIRAGRGGDYYNVGSIFPASDRDDLNTGSSYDSHIRFSSDFNNRIVRVYKLKCVNAMMNTLMLKFI
ncbi:MAG: bis(5'-nucleosyl)-tetraphosphatase (symmetrical) YqeK [Christensenellales bacterium]